ncbi:MAG TPA: hypothetical protein VLL54_00640 [Pyrinomonadaceae bacterium]|nr:hypothetical protein [Pyrinomonadaceae bacterium]
MPRKSRLLFVALCLTLVATCVLAGFAQSGRRVRKPTVTSVPEITPTPTPTAEKSKPALTFLVCMDRHADYTKVPLASSSAVMYRCANRLDEPAAVAVNTDSREVNRAEAIKRAKAEKEAYVVWLKLLQNNVAGRASSGDTYDLYIQYEVFQPVTAKTETSGRVFPTAYRDRGVIVQPRTQSVSDYYLVEAGRATGEAILEHFHIK